MLASDDPAEVEAAQKIAVFWPNQDGRGVHVTVSAGGVTQSAQPRDNAIKLLEFLMSDDAQKIYDESVSDIQVKPVAPDAAEVAVFGQHNVDTLHLDVSR